MTAEELIDALQAKALLSDAMLEKLRQKTATGGKSLTAKSLASFLIDKGHLSKHQAMAALAPTGKTTAAPPAEPAPVPKEPVPKEPVPSPVKLPGDELQDLSSSAEWSLDKEGGFPEAPAEQPTTNKSKKKKGTKGKKGDEWDSPLLLIGGGSLMLLLIIGGVVGYIMNAEGADKTLAQARTAMDEGSYGNGIANYEKFVEKWPHHADFSTARVELAMARIRQTVEIGNASLALKAATEELHAIDEESNFSDAQEQLSDLLPRIARSLADQAEASKELAQTNTLFEQAKTALGMTNNTKYVPKSRRDKTELEGIRQTIDRIARRQQSRTDLQEALATIETAVGAGDTQSAYATQKVLVDKHPSLLGNAELAEALAHISQAESKSIRFVKEPIEAKTDDPNSSILATLAIANLRQPGNAPVQGAFCAQVSGVAYGLDTSNGKLLWRRYLGPTVDQIYPQTVASDLLLVEWNPTKGDQQRQALLRVDATTGKLKWRLELDDHIAEPVVSGDRIYLSGASGKLHLVEADSGTRTGYVQFPQPLESPPVVREKTGKLYVTGEHSSLYTLSTEDLSCTGVFYTKHPRGSIVAAPIVAIDKAIVVENDGLETCKLRLFSLDNDGNIIEALVERRLEGRVVRQPQVEGRRFMAITDRGRITLYEVSLGTDGEPLTMLATRAARGGTPFVRFGAVDGGDLWLAENTLTKYAVAPTGNRLSVQELVGDYSRSQFVTPLEIRNNVLLFARSRRGRAGFTVTAADTKTGNAYWQSDIGSPAAGNPLASTSPVALLEADANGQVYLFDRNTLRSRVQNNALPAPTKQEAAALFDHSILVDGGAAVFSSVGSDQVLLYSPSASQPLSRSRLPGPLACPPIPFAKGWIAPLSVGQVFLLDSKSGKPIAAPFQPKLQPGRTIEWLSAGVAEHDRFVISDGIEKIYLVEWQQGNKPALVAVGEAAVGPSPLTTAIVVLGNLAFAGTDDGWLAQFQLPGLDAGERIKLGSPVVWGPYRAGNHVVLRTERGDLVAIDAQGAKAWSVLAPPSPFAGPPLAEGELIVATQKGTLLRIDRKTGREAGRVDIGQPIASGPVILGKNIVVAAHDGTPLVVETP